MKAIQNCVSPSSIRKLRSFLSLKNQVRDYISGFSALIAPLTGHMRGKTKRSTENILWNEEILESFSRYKNLIAKVTQRAHPGPSLTFIVTTDASNSAIEANILQELDDKRLMIHTASKVLDTTQTNYSVTGKELLVAVKSIEHFKYYLLGKRFILETDHHALKYLQQATQPNSRMVRWSFFL